MSSGLDFGGGDNGLGNLADELAEAWDEDEEEVEYHENCADELPAQRASNMENTRDSGIDVASSPALAATKPSSALSPSQDNPRGKHRRKASDYDGSDYGEDSDFESAGMSPGLEARLSVVESLARQGTGDSGLEASDGVVKRVVEYLKDLGGQAGVESGTTRLVTAHNSLSLHLSHQTRTLQSLTFSIFSPLSYSLDPDLIDELLPILSTTATLIPSPSPTVLPSLSALSAMTTELISTLSVLSDSLHMSRQTTNTASRRLKAATELVREIRRESDEREEGVRWIERGDWSRRLQERECKAVCGDVVDGFEEVCAVWRERLVAGLGAA
ncbi:MAG: hypothetical protein M1824_003979 [Vezdaea acicularis]|nr:MAG: hypothetical protein M1824_003979 [Vezdaea acicularis]